MQDQAPAVESSVAPKLSDRRTIEETGSGEICLASRCNKKHLNHELKTQPLKRGTSIGEETPSHLNEAFCIPQQSTHPNVAKDRLSDTRGAFWAGQYLRLWFFTPTSCWAEDLQFFDSVKQHRQPATKQYWRIGRPRRRLQPFAEEGN
jgi:hypothetical protein